MIHARVGAMLVAILGITFGACAAIVDFPERGARVVDAGANEPDAPSALDSSDADGSDSGTADPCRQSGLPPRPPKNTSAPGDALKLTLALREIDFGTRASGTVDPPGLNLDGFCSCPGPQACVPFSALPICDTQHGVDNQSARLFKLFTLNSGTRPPDDRYNDAVHQGILGFLIVVTGYNGLADDEEVAVSVFGSGGTAPLPDGGAVVPTWNGSDEWQADPASLVFVGRPLVAKFNTPRGYVAGGRLVAELTYAVPLVADLPKGGPAFSLRFEGGVLAGKLEEVGGLWTLEDGMMAGRWPTRDVLRVMGLAADPANEAQRICDNLSSYGSLKQLICNYADLSIKQDVQPAVGHCDAISMGIGFRATSALLGPIGVDKPAPTPCPNTGDDCP